MSPARALALLSLALLLAAGPAAAGEPSLSGSAKVLTGDRLELAGQRLRLIGIVAPVPAQRCLIEARLYDCGKVSATALMDLTAGADVVCTPDGPADPDGTRPARCRAAGYDLSEGMVYTGWALADPVTGGPYADQQATAKARRHGLWKGRFVAPWDWAQGERLPEEEGGQEG